MTRLHLEIQAVFDKAHDEALKLIIARGNVVIPERWGVVLAWGWGITVFDSDRNTVAIDELPTRLSPFKKFLGDCEEFESLFGYSNQRLARDRKTVKQVYKENT